MDQNSWKTKQIEILNCLAGKLEPTVIDSVDWPRMASWLQHVNLGAAGYHMLGPVFSEAKSHLQEAYYGNIYRDMAQKQVFQEMLNSLQDHELDIMLLKGAALASLAWDEPHVRFQSDIDFLVQRPELHTIAQVLHKANFRFRKPDAIGRFYDDLPDTNKEGQLEMVSSSDSQVVLEAHTEVFLGHVQRITAERVEEQLWERRVKATPVGVENMPIGIRFWRLSNEDLIIHVMIHTAINHQFDENSLRNMLDVIRLAQRIQIDWHVVHERVSSMKMKTAVWLFMHTAAQIWQNHPFDSVIDQLKPSRLRQRWLTQMINLDVILDRRILRLSKRRYLLLLLMVDRPVDMFRLLVRLPFLKE
ncbi:MAG: nucleotidyltransferase family protein [Chloroflexota bacterium]